MNKGDWVLTRQDEPQVMCYEGPYGAKPEDMKAHTPLFEATRPAEEQKYVKM